MSARSPTGTPHEARVRESLRDFVQQARAGLQPEEVALALVRRLGRALGLAHCSFVVTGAGDDAGRVIADLSDGRSEHARLDLARYPEILEAVRSRRTLAMPDMHAGAPGDARTMVMPVIVDDAVAGVLAHARARRRRPGSARPSSAWPEAWRRRRRARSMAHVRPTAVPRIPPPAALDRRLQEELERARRYSLSFSLVLLHPEDAVRARGHRSGGRRASQRQELVGRIRGELRLPDFVSSYGGDELALVLPETGADGARRWVVRIRERLDGVSAGIVAYPHPSVTVPDDLLALVEAALRRGRAQAGERIGVAE